MGDIQGLLWNAESERTVGAVIHYHMCARGWFSRSECSNNNKCNKQHKVYVVCTTDSNWHPCCNKIIVFWIIGEQHAVHSSGMSVKHSAFNRGYYCVSCWYLSYREKEWGGLGRGNALVAVCILDERLIQQAGRWASHFVGVWKSPSICGWY